MKLVQRIAKATLITLINLTKVLCCAFIGTVALVAFLYLADRFESVFNVIALVILAIVFVLVVVILFIETYGKVKEKEESENTQ